MSAAFTFTKPRGGTGEDARTDGPAVGDALRLVGDCAPPRETGVVAVVVVGEAARLGGAGGRCALGDARPGRVVDCGCEALDGVGALAGAGDEPS